MFEHMLPLIAVAIFGQACNGIALADEKKPDAVQIVALDDSAISITTEDLRKLPRTSIEVLDRSGKKVQYSGVAVHQLLAKANAPMGEELRGEALRCYVAVKAKDEYRVVFALCEFDPEFALQPILLADQQDGQPLAEETGPFQIIVPDEKRRARWVRQVVRIRVMESRVVDEDMPVSEKQ
jgi:hypothetical protein